MQMKNIQIGNGGLLVQKAEIGNCLHGDIEANKSQFVGLLKNPLGTKDALLYSPAGSISAYSQVSKLSGRSFILCQQKKNG